jgi:hypothetical protein
MKIRMQNSNLNRLASVATIAAAIVAASLMSSIDTASAGKGGDRAPAPRTVATTTKSLLPHIGTLNENKAPLGKKTDKLCPSGRCHPHYQHGDPHGDQ